MAYYPLLLELSGCRCLVVGAGRVGARKIASLLERAPAQVLVLDLMPPSGAMLSLLEHPALIYENRAFTEADLDGRTLVFAATSDPALNQRIAQACAKRGTLCNVADAPSSGNVIVPASLERHGVTLSVSTQGQSPALCRILKEELAPWLDESLACAPVLELLGHLRPHITALPGESEAHARIFRSLGEKDFRLCLGAAMAAQDKGRCLSLLQERLPQTLMPALDSVLSGLFTGFPKEPSRDLP